MLEFSLARGGTAAGAHLHAQILPKSATNEFASKLCSAIIARSGAAIFALVEQQAGYTGEDQHGAGDDDGGRGAHGRMQIRRVDRAFGSARITFDDDMLIEVVVGVQG